MHGFETDIYFAITPSVVSAASLWFIPSAWQVQNCRYVHVSSRIRNRPNGAEIETAKIVDGDGEAGARAGKAGV